MTGISTIKIGIIDDNEVTRSVLKALLTHHNKPSFNFVLALESLLELQAIKNFEAHPEVVLLSMSLLKVNGVKSIPMLLTYFPNCLIIMLSDVENREVTIEAMRAGAHAYVMKDANQQALVQVITRVIEGRANLDTTI